MWLQRAALAVLILIATGMAADVQAANLDCKLGPIEKTYGGTQWNVYGCADKKSVVVMTAPGNPAMPFYFFFTPASEGYQLHGEGTGDKKVTDAAYKDLSALTESDIAALAAETSSH